MFSSYIALSVNSEMSWNDVSKHMEKQSDLQFASLMIN